MAALQVSGSLMSLDVSFNKLGAASKQLLQDLGYLFPDSRTFTLWEADECAGGIKKPVGDKVAAKAKKNAKSGSRYWRKSEVKKLSDAKKRFGKTHAGKWNYKLIAQYIGTRSVKAVRDRIRKDVLRAQSGIPKNMGVSKSKSRKRK